VARTKQGRQEAAPLRQGRFGRGSTGQAQKPRRFARSASQPEQSGTQKLMQAIRGVLPGGRGKSSAKSGTALSAAMAGVGGLVGSLGGKKGRRGGRARKPAMFGALGAGAAGAAAVVAKRRHTSRSSEPAGETRDVPEARATATPPKPDTPAAGDSESASPA
jgi:hypothetical protein